MELDGEEHLGPVAARTVQQHPEPSRAFLVDQNPGPLLKRRPVPDVPATQTRQVGHPVTIGVVLETDDRTLHGTSLAHRRRATSGLHHGDVP
jgi:hypothetical protein